MKSLEEIANYIVSDAKGILAADESTPTIGKRFASINTESTENSRRDYREMLFSASGMKGNIGGVILFEDVVGGRFEDLGEAYIALIQIMTLSSWESLMMPIVEIYPYAWMYFISFVILSSIIVLNLFVAILVDVVSERRKRQEEEKLSA